MGDEILKLRVAN